MQAGSISVESHVLYGTNMLDAAAVLTGQIVVADRVIDIITLQDVRLAGDAGQYRVHGAGAGIEHLVGLGQAVLLLPHWGLLCIRLPQVQEVSHHVLD